jgi:RNA polymerase sigma-70 factor (ECF subfamily)
MGEIQGEPSGAAELLRSARGGDRVALEQLVVPHKQPLFALCYGMLGHADDAEDAVQETFLRALGELGRFRGEAAFRTWLFRIAVNLCLNWKRDRRPTEPWDEACPCAAPGAATPEASALQQLEIAEALRQLPPRQRGVLLLKVVQGWSVAEIGDALGWSPIRVKNELAKARRALAEWQVRQDVGGEQG